MDEEEGRITTHERSRLIINNPVMDPPTKKTADLKLVLMISSVVVSFVLLCLASNNTMGLFLSNSSTFYSLNPTSASQLPPVEQDDLIHDEYYELRKALKAAATKENTVILTTLNEAWAKPNSTFDLFLESFRNGNNTARLLNHLLVIAVDEKAHLRCQALVPHCYLFKSNRSTEMANEAWFMTPIYLEMMWRRQAFLQTILALGYNFVFTDTDIMWFRDPFPHFDPNVDFQTSCDQFNGNPYDLNNYPNNGFNFVRSNNRTIEFYKYWVSSRWTYPGVHEQDVFNKIKHDPYTKKIGLTFRFLDTDYFGGFCSPSKDFNKVCTMHANCCVGLDWKITDLKIILQDWKRYLSSPTNQTMSFHWRAPYKCPKLF